MGTQGKGVWEEVIVGRVLEQMHAWHVGRLIEVNTDENPVENVGGRKGGKGRGHQQLHVGVPGAVKSIARGAVERAEQ